MCFSKNTNLFLFLDSCRTGIWLSSLSQTLPRPLRSLFLQTAAHPVSSPRPSLQSEGETEPHDTSLKLQPCFVPPSPGPWVSSGHPGILSSMFHVVVITGWGEGEEGGGSHTCKSSPWHPFLLMVMPLSKAASSAKIAGLNSPHLSNPSKPGWKGVLSTENQAPCTKCHHFWHHAALCSRINTR